MRNRRNVIVGVLVFLTLILGGIAIYVAYQVTLQQSPDDSSADVTCPSGTTKQNIGTLGDRCVCNNDSNIRIGLGSTDADVKVLCLGIYGDCPEGTTYILDTTGAYCQCKNDLSLSIDLNSTSNSLCFVGNNNRTTLETCDESLICKDADGCICPTGCQYENITVGVSCGGTKTSGGGDDGGGSDDGGGDSGTNTCSGACFTLGSTYNGVTINNCGSVGRVTGSGSCSSSGDLCCAIQGSTGGGTTVDTRSSCGGKCTTTADCKPAATTGIEVTCRNGICENAACPAGKTVPGANCACGSLNACGAPCSDEVGLCQTGSTCGFLLPNTNNVSAESCLSQAYTTNQRCLPVSPQGGYTLAQCGDIATVYLTTSTGSRVTDLNSLLDACGQNPVVGASVVCGDGICSVGESNATCPSDCAVGQLPGTAIFNDRIDAIIVGILLIFVGLSLYFRVDILKRK